MEERFPWGGPEGGREEGVRWVNEAGGEPGESIRGRGRGGAAPPPHPPPSTLGVRSPGSREARRGGACRLEAGRELSRRLPPPSPPAPAAPLSSQQPPPPSAASTATLLNQHWGNCEGFLLSGGLTWGWGGAKENKRSHRYF